MAATCAIPFSKWLVFIRPSLAGFDCPLTITEVCAQKHLSFSTQKAYTLWLRAYGQFLQSKPPSPTATPELKIEAFLTHVATTGVSVSTQNQAFNALLFFYRTVLKQELGDIQALRAKRTATLRECPSPAQVGQLLAAVRDLHGYPTRLIVHLLYACGLRVNEPLNLRIKDLDLVQSRFFINQAKGNKGRVVTFPACLAPALRQQLQVAQAMAAADRAQRVPVPLPDRLATKYPSAALSERWAWLFPARRTCLHPRTGVQVRWRCHAANVQRAVKAAAHQWHLDGLTPHHLRHAFATHALQNGAFVHDLQAVLGHSHLDTTMRYLHTEAARVASPLHDFIASPISP